MLRDESYFGACYEYVEISKFVDMCRFDACHAYLDSTLKNDISQCQVIEAYVVMCLEISGANSQASNSSIIGDWRSDALLGGFCGKRSFPSPSPLLAPLFSQLSTNFYADFIVSVNYLALFFSFEADNAEAVFLLKLKSYSLIDQFVCSNCRSLLLQWIGLPGMQQPLHHAIMFRCHLLGWRISSTRLLNAMCGRMCVSRS